MPPDAVQVAVRVARAIEQVGAPYLVGGSLASSRHGLPRSTMDIDLVADLQEEQILFLVDLLQNEFYVDAEMIRDAIRQRSSFNVTMSRQHSRSMSFCRSVLPGASFRWSVAG